MHRSTLALCLLLLLGLSLFLPSLLSAQIEFTKHPIDESLSGAYWVYATDLDRDGDIDVVAASTNRGLTWYKNNGSGSFSKRTVGSFSGAWGCYAKDVDGDGDIDVLGASSSLDEIAWWENNGREEFSKRLLDNEFLSAESVFAADLDGDGDIDIMGAAWGLDQIAWWENRGGRRFTKRVLDSNLSGAHSVFAADINGDGRNDVIASGASKTVWYVNNGGGNFSRRTIDSNDGGLGVFSVDLDGDRDMDVLRTARQTEDIDWFRNNGSGSFGKNIIAPGFGNSWSVVGGDVDGDGDIDVVSGGIYNDKVVLWENDGRENFREQIVDDNFDGVRSVYVADLDGDGDGDIIAAARDVGDLAWWEVRGKKKSQPADKITVVSPNGGEEWLVGSTRQIEWSSEGSISNVKIEYSTNGGSNWNTVVSSTANDGSYSWDVPDTPSSNSLVRVSDASDGNPSDTSDGSFSIVAAGTEPAITVTRPNGGESWWAGRVQEITWNSQRDIESVKLEYSVDNGRSWTVIESSSPNDGTYSWTLPDQESDSALVRVSDALDGAPSDVSDAVFSIKQPVTTTVTFTNVTTSAGIATEPSGTHAAAIADFDNDGFPDIYINSQEDDRITSGGYTGNYLFKNEGDGTFRRVEDVAGVEDIASWAHASLFFDMDRDGDYDLVVGHSIDGLPRRGLFQNNGDGTFTQVDETAGFENSGDIGTRSIVAGDLNGDGFMDVYFSSFNGFDIEGYIGDGFGNFVRDDGLTDQARSIQGMIAADLDGDGDLDVLMGNFDTNNGIGYYGNDGSGRFSRVLGSGLPETGFYTTANLADVDADGDLDALVISPDDAVAYLYFNNGGAFELVQQITLQSGCPGGCGSGNGVLGDFDNDGDVDLFLPTAVRKLWLNDGSGNFSGVDDETTGLLFDLEDARFPAVLDYDRDGDLDLFIALHDGASLLFRNDLDNNQAVRLRITGPYGDVGGFGTKVWAYEEGYLGDATRLIGYQEAMASAGYSIQNEPVLHFGLGTRSAVDLRVMFIDGTTMNLSSVAAGQTLDVSNPANVVLAPNGGESLVVGQTTDIQWAFDHAIDSVRIEFSNNAGQNWEDVTPSTPNDGRYRWTIPDAQSDSALIRISDAADADPSDVSDAVFSIVPAPAPTVTVTSPNGGESWLVGSKQDIQWMSEGDLPWVRIELSRDNGVTWSVISDSTENTGAYTWTVPDAPSEESLVRISDASDGEPSDVSDGVFSIVAAADAGNALNFDGTDDLAIIPDNSVLSGGLGKSITVEAWVNLARVSGFNPIVVKFLDANWKDWGLMVNGGQLVAVIENGGDNWEYGAGEVAADVWTHVAFTYDNASGTVRLFIDGDQVGEMTHSKEMPDTEAPIVFGNNNYGANYMAGLLDEVRVWNYARNAEELAGGMNRVLRGDEPGLIGYWRFDEGEGQLSADLSGTGNDVRLGTTDAVDSSDPAWVASDAPLSAEPFVQVTSPNGGERWTAGTTREIQWLSGGSISAAKIDFSSDGGASWTVVADSVANSGSYLWTVPEVESSNCLIRVSDAVDGDPSDVSDGVFSIILATNAGYALNFDGTDDLAIIPDNSVLSGGSGKSITVEAWVSLARVSGFNPIVTKFRDANWKDWGLMVNGGQLVAVIENGGDNWEYGAGEVAVNVWTHVAFTYDNASGTVRLFIDGEQAGETTHSKEMPDTEAPIVFGNNNYGNDYMEGLLDEVRIWDHARTQAQLQEGMSTRLDGTETGLLGYWRFDEGSGQVTADLSENENAVQLGATEGQDASDPSWIESDAPIASVVASSLLTADNKVTAVDKSGGLPSEYRLLGNYPNPFNMETKIAYELPRRSHVKLVLFDLLGHELRTLVQETQEPGTYEVRWDGRDKSGKIVASGVYIYRIRAGSFRSSRKLLILR